MTGTGFGSLESYRTSCLLHFSHCWQGGCSSSDCPCGSSSTDAADVAVSCKVSLTGIVQSATDVAVSCIVPLTGRVQSPADVARFRGHGLLEFQSLFSAKKMTICY
jgi:hypothetical protein